MDCSDTSIINLAFYNAIIKSQKELEQWNKYFRHFPDELVDTIRYECLFIPRVLQGNAIYKLRIFFNSSEDARAYFEEHSVPYEKSFIGINDFGLICEPDLAFFSGAGLNEQSVTRFLSFAWCGAGGGYTHKLRGYAAGIALNEDQNTVFCWFRDHYP